MTKGDLTEKRRFINPDFRYAVVGATTNTAKYGYRVLMDLHSAGYDVVGVNPKYTEIEGIRVYPTLADIPEKPDVAIFVVPPQVGVNILEQVAALGIRKVWFQPGAEDGAVQARIGQLGLEGSADGACIMVTRKALGL